MMEISKVAEICKALSDENRIRIIEMLTQGEKCGCELLEQLHITQPTLSHHMKVLENTGLISSQKEGKWMHYSINCEMFQTFRSYISNISCCDNIKESKNSRNCSCNCGQ
jgi:ArsR family transcriptional regulator